MNKIIKSKWIQEIITFVTLDNSMGVFVLTNIKIKQIKIQIRNKNKKTNTFVCKEIYFVNKEAQR